MHHPVTVAILGCRGSLPVSGRQFSRYGGATCCALIRCGESVAVLDAGTGILSLPEYLREEKDIPIFITHCHADHILGLPLCPPMFDPSYHFSIYGAQREDQDISAQVHALMSPPLWPVGTAQLPAEVTFHRVCPRMECGVFTVESMEGRHPGGVTLYRITADDRRIVYLTDCTITQENREALLELCRGCDLLLCDGQYSEEEWPTHASFGHNCWTTAAQFGADCGAKAVRILHHDPGHCDAVLDRAREQVRAVCSVCDLAYDKEEIIL